MVDYLYDGSFEGFLTCIYYHFYEGKASGIYPESSYQGSLLSRPEKVTTDPELADRVYRAIGEKISQQALQRAYYIFLSNGADKDRIAFRYILLGFRVGASVDSLHSDPVVFAAQQLAKKVSFEAHRMGGLIRFAVLESGILYAKVKPDHDILELIGDHFADRFRCEPFLIHDTGRKKALYSREGQWVIAPLDEQALPDLAADEKEYRHLWKLYFEHIAIEARKNPKCQKRFMPVRYWDNLTEMH